MTTREKPEITFVPGISEEVLVRHGVDAGEYQRIYDDWFKGKNAKGGFELPLPQKIRTVIENQCPFGAETWLDKKT